MSKVLVTGCAGFLGSHLCESLLRSGHVVYGMDDLSGGMESNVPAGMLWEESSFCNERAVEAVFKGFHPDYVAHLGAYAAEGLSHFIRRFNYHNNLIGSVNLINAAVRHGCKGFIFTSSAAVYGDIPTPYSEEDRPRPVDPYGVAKLAVEMDLECAHRMWGLPYMIFRPHNIYGERQNCADPYRNVIGIFMRQALAGEPLTIFGDGTQMRGFTHVSDVAPVIADAIGIESAWNQTFNIGSGIPHTVNHVADCVFRAFAKQSHSITIQHLPARDEVGVVLCNHSKARGVFGVRDEVKLVDGIERMAAWVKQNPPQTPTPFAQIEVENGLPPSWAALTGVIA